MDSNWIFRSSIPSTPSVFHSSLDILAGFSIWASSSRPGSFSSSKTATVCLEIFCDSCSWVSSSFWDNSCFCASAILAFFSFCSCLDDSFSWWAWLFWKSNGVRRQNITASTSTSSINNAVLFLIISCLYCAFSVLTT